MPGGPGALPPASVEPPDHIRRQAVTVGVTGPIVGWAAHATGARPGAGQHG